MQTIHLEPAMVPAHLRGGYAGKKFSAHLVDSVTIPADAGQWSGGARDTFALIRLADGASVPAIEPNAAPWHEGKGDKLIKLQSGFAVTRRSTVAGKDSGFAFFLLPSDAAPMLPAPVKLGRVERLVLDATARFKAKVGTRDRYELAATEYAWGSDKAAFPTRAEWDKVKGQLAESGMLNHAGAITVKGRNAIAKR